MVWHVRVRYAAPLAWMGFIFWLSSQPSLPSAPDPLFDLVLKKVGHAVLYAILALLWSWALEREALPPARRARLAVIAAILYAVLDELHQAFTPGRHPTITDVGIDSVGAIVAMKLVPPTDSN